VNFLFFSLKHVCNSIPENNLLHWYVRIYGISSFLIFKLWPWCFAFTLFESDNVFRTSRLEIFYGPWINWLMSSPNTFDRECRIGASFKIFWRRRCLSFRNLRDLSLYRYELLKKVSCDKLTCRVLRRDVFGMRSNTSQICFGMLKKILIPNFGYGLFTKCSGVVSYVLLPLYIISSLWNLIYPFLALFKVGLDAQYIQILLSMIYFLWLCIACICFPAMCRYRRLISTVPVQAIDLSSLLSGVGSLECAQNMNDVLSTIQREYAEKLNQVYIGQIIHHFFQRLSPLMLEMLGPPKNKAFDRDIFFLRDPLRYCQERLTIYEITYDNSVTGKNYNTKETDSYSIDRGLMTPLLEAC